MNRRVEKIKNHLREHKQCYMIGAGVVVVSVAAAVALRRGGLIINDSFKLQWKSTTTNEIITNLPDTTNYANAVLDLDNGIAYPSQNHAAKALGWTSRQMSAHLNGHVTMPNAPHLERLERLIAA